MISSRKLSRLQRWILLAAYRGILEVGRDEPTKRDLRCSYYSPVHLVAGRFIVHHCGGAASRALPSFAQTPAPNIAWFARQREPNFGTTGCRGETSRTPRGAP